jgi:hypothetical protein
MAAPFYFYGNGRLKLWNGGIDLDSDTIKIALVTSSYTPNKDTHDFWDDIVANEASGTGYSAGGATLGSVTLALTAANSWGTAWASSTAYAVGDVVKPLVTNGNLYRCVVAGTSDSSAPTWSTTRGVNVTDNTVTWVNIGTNIVVFDAADAAWTTSTVTARYAVVYKSTGTNSTSAVIGYFDFGGNVSSTAATFTVQFSTAGICYST